MKRRVSSQEVERQWDVLLKQIPRKHNLASSSPATATTTTNGTSNDEVDDNRKKPPSSTTKFRHRQQQQPDQEEAEEVNDEVDPFDCSDIVVPTTHQLVKKAAEDAVREWQALDDRKIVVDRNVDHRPTKRGRPFGSKNSNLRLPVNFDFSLDAAANRASKNYEDDDDDNNLLEMNICDEDRVISLEDPTKQLSYRQELYKIFDNVPTAEEIEYEGRSKSKLKNTVALYQEITDGIKKVPRLDGHVLSRLRRNDRHGLPPIPSSSSVQSSGNKTTTTNTTTISDSPRAQNLISTIRFEFWKRQLKRGSSPNSNRMVIEFLTTQTLWDVHMYIVQLLEDDLWDSIKEEEKRKKSDGTNQSEDYDDGCFFIENVFYITEGGKVDYAKPILEWIDGNKGSEEKGKEDGDGSRDKAPNHPARRGYLGLTMKDIPVKSMKDTILGSIPMRLGMRYYHCCHGDVEISMYLTDKRVTMTNMPTAALTRTSNKNVHDHKGYHHKYPLLHDVWTAAYPQPYCDACKYHAATYVTPADCEMTDGGARQLCQHCCKQLRLLDDDRDDDIGNIKRPRKVMPFDVWRREADLSTSADLDTSRYF